MYLGNFAVSGTVSHIWNSVSASGVPTAMTTSGVIVVLKNGTGRRASTAGVTYTANYTALPGNNYVAVDTSDNTDAGFYVAGADYTVIVSGQVTAGYTKNEKLFSFSLNNRAMLSEVLETGFSASDLIQLMAATLLGKVTYTGGTVKFRDVNDTVDRVTATVDANEQRLTVTYDLS